MMMKKYFTSTLSALLLLSMQVSGAAGTVLSKELDNGDILRIEKTTLGKDSAANLAVTNQGQKIDVLEAADYIAILSNKAQTQASLVWSNRHVSYDHGPTIPTGFKVFDATVVKDVFFVSYKVGMLTFVEPDARMPRDNQQHTQYKHQIFRDSPASNLILTNVHLHESTNRVLAITATLNDGKEIRWILNGQTMVLDKSQLSTALERVATNSLDRWSKTNGTWVPEKNEANKIVIRVP